MTQVLNHMKKLKQHSKEFFVIFSSGVTSYLERGVLLLRWNDLHWNRDLDRSVFCHFRRNRPSGFSKTFLLHGDSLHGHEHHLCPFCHSLDRLCWHWYRKFWSTWHWPSICVRSSIVDWLGSGSRWHHHCRFFLPCYLHFKPSPFQCGLY